MNSNIYKTINYIKRNGMVKTFWAVLERLGTDEAVSYEYTPISEEERLTQIEKSLELSASFSILVPAYETKPEYLKALIESVLSQTYGNWELIIADAGSSGDVAHTVQRYEDKRIVYVKLPKNGGISENSNAALKYCSKEYVGLLDHDDILCTNALYENAVKIEEAKKKNVTLQMLYSDEDKTDGENTRFFEPNIKPGFNFDLILSNNYICHFLVIRTGLIKELGFRKEFDGAQDHDLVLRVVSRLKALGTDYEKEIMHISKVLYHWRCHEQSTAANPMSKRYAYEAGKRAVESFLEREGVCATVEELPHVGFFRVNYEPDILTQRKEVCASAGRIIGRKSRVIGGVYDEDKNVMFEGLNKHSSGGYLHRAACQMEVPYVDVRYASINKEGSEVLRALLKDTKGRGTDYRELSFKFCDIMKERGYKFVYDPNLVTKAEK